MYLTLNTASGMCYYSKLREAGSKADLTREGLFCIRKNRCLDPPQATPYLEPVDDECSVQVRRCDEKTVPFSKNC